MNSFVYLLCAAVALSSFSPSQGTRGPTRLCGRKYCSPIEFINAHTNGEAVGSYTQTHGNSQVNLTPYGSQGSLSHGAKGVGVGHTAARSGGAIEQGSIYGSSSLGSEAEARAFGSHGSISQTQGNAGTLNGFGGSGSSSYSQGSGIGLSAAQSSARGGRTFRHKRQVDVDVYAGSKGEAGGQFTDTFGDSEANSNDFGFSARAKYGSRGYGAGGTHAISGGGAGANSPYGGVHSESEGRARAFGTHQSYSDTTGESQVINGLRRSQSSANSFASGTGVSRSGSSATASSSRAKRHVGRPIPCRHGLRCGISSIDSETDASAVGPITDSFGRSSVQSDLFGDHGSFSAGSRGAGIGYTAAQSKGRISSSWGQSGAAGQAQSFGNLGSQSATRVGGSNWNGFSNNAASSHSMGSGFGLSQSRSSAQANGGRFKRSLYHQNNRRPFCIGSRCYSDVSGRTRGEAFGDRTESFGDSSISAQPGLLTGFARQGSRAEGFGRTGASAGSRIDSLSQYGHETSMSNGEAEGFGQRSSSWSNSNTQTVNGFSVSGTDSGATAGGRGRSFTRSGAQGFRRNY